MLGEAGYKEVTLLGQNVDAYGRDLPGAAADGSGRRAWTFTDLLRHVHDVPGIQRIRFATSHPRCPTSPPAVFSARRPEMPYALYPKGLRRNCGPWPSCQVGAASQGCIRGSQGFLTVRTRRVPY